MKKLIIVGICTVLLLGIPFTSLVANPKPIEVNTRAVVTNPDNGDPDGPTKGFLDDPTDWKYLGKSIFWFARLNADLMAWYVGIFNITTLEQLEDFIANQIDYLENLTGIKELLYWVITLSVLTDCYILGGCLCEAFDFMDLDRDGC